VDRRTRTVFVLALVFVVAATAAAALLLNGPGTLRSATSPSVVGVIVGVESEGLDRVRGFTLRTGTGATEAFTIGTLENPTAFPPGHLVEHQATAQPVRVWYVAEGSTNVAIRLQDAATP
jgi:hypothetical protein